MSALDRVQKAFDGIDFEIVEVADGTPCFEVKREALHDCVRILRDQCGFQTNTFVTAVDHLPNAPRYELSYQFLSIENADRVRLKTRLEESDARIATITDLFEGTAYSEREVYDFFGIEFDGHEGLKRLHMPDGYGHYPLRKDFPHRGIEPDRLYREWEREHAGGDTYRS